MTGRMSAAIVILLLTCGAAAAQEAPRGRAVRPGPLAPGAVAEMLDAYAIVQARQVLQLTEAQQEQFIPRLMRLHETRRRGQQARNKILADLRRMTGPQAQAAADDATIRERLTALREHDERAAEAVLRAYEAADEVLDARQQARFRLFEEQLERRKFDLLMRARQRAARGGS